MIRWWCAAMAAGTCAAPGWALEWPTHRARPKPLTSLPCYPYQPVSSTETRPTVTSATLVRLPLTASRDLDPPSIDRRSDILPSPAELRIEPRSVVFQLSESRLQIDHCFLSRVAVTLYEDGRYLVSFRADQNPRPGDVANQIRSPLLPTERLSTVLQTSQFRRNLFVLRVRGYGLSPSAVSRVGAPALVDIPLEPFAVQKGEPYSGQMSGRSDAVRRAFDQIDRMEIDFTYR